jgi:CheY-like chemotaxis protein
MTPKRILIIDDDEDLRYLWAEALGNRGYDVVSVGDGTRALAELKGFEPDLIILDLIMPRASLDGVGFLARLNADPRLPTAPILVISGLGDPLGSKLTPETATSFGIVGILSKPMGLDTLAHEVEKVLRDS